MSSDQDSGDKSFEPTQKKLEDARKKGEVVRSTDLNATAMYLGVLLAAAGFGASTIVQFSEPLAALLAR